MYLGAMHCVFATNRVREGLIPCYIPPDNAEDDSEWAIDVQWNRSANGYRLLTEAE